MLRINYKLSGNDHKGMVHRSYIILNLYVNKDYKDSENKKFGLYPRDKSKLRWAFSTENNDYENFESEYNHSEWGWDQTYLTQDIILYLYKENIIDEESLKAYCTINANIDLKFAELVIDIAGLSGDELNNFDVDLDYIKYNGYEQIYNTLVKYPTLVSKRCGIFLKTKSQKEKQYMKKLEKLGYDCYDKDFNQTVSKEYNNVHSFILMLLNFRKID